MSKTDIRHAATVLVLRDKETTPKVLMGQRGKAASFMPSKFVFPGGAVDPEDALVSLNGPKSANSLHKLRQNNDAVAPDTLMLAAIRELWEETGLILSDVSSAPAPTNTPDNWAEFFNQGHIPTARGITFLFRAVTPPGRPRRFDARFLLVDASELSNDPDDFSAASGELSHLQWVDLNNTKDIDLPFVTEIVLAELRDHIKRPDAGRDVPFFYHNEGRSCFRRL